MDVTSVTVSNDDADGLKFVIAIPSNPTLPSGKQVGLYLDIDRNVGTGSPGGSEGLAWFDGTARFYRWDATAKQFTLDSGVTVSGGYGAGFETIELNRSALGDVAVFDFKVLTWADTTVEDAAPSSGIWTYTVQISPPQPVKKLAITGSTRSPRVPVAGESFTVDIDVRRVGWSGRFDGTLFCEAKIFGQKIRWFGSISPGRAACRWVIPRNAAGKTIAGSLTVSEGGASARQLFTARIRQATATLAQSGDVTTSPDQPTAGHTFYYYLGVSVHIGSGAPKRIATGTVRCQATISGKSTLPKVVQQVVRPLAGANCGWAIPYGTSGHLLTGTIVVRSAGAVLTHRFALRVR